MPVKCRCLRSSGFVIGLASHNFTEDGRRDDEYDAMDDTSV